MKVPAELTIIDHCGIVKHVPLDKEVFTIGRHADNDLQVLGADVSRQHAEIRFEENSFFIVDRGSKWGTFVNGSPAVRQALRHQDFIRLGTDSDVEIQFIDTRPSTAGQAEAAGSSQERAGPGGAHEELQKLAQFLEVNRALRFSLSLQEVFCLIVDSAIEISQADRGCLMLREADGAVLCRVARDRDRKTLNSDELVPSRSAIERALRDGRSVIVEDSLEDSRFSGQESVINLDLRTIICIPLQRFRMNERLAETGIDSKEVIGALYVDRRQITGVISETLVSLMESLAFEVSKALESVRLMHQEEEKRRLEREFSMARDVQLALLTNSELDTEHADAVARSLPSRYVAGDFFDLFALEDGRSVLVVGDVSGKGISAALLASMAQGILRAQLGSGQPLVSVITDLNRLLVQNSHTRRFITLFCGVLDPEGNFTFINAGHNPPFLLRAGGPTECLSTNSMLLGAFDTAQFSEQRTKLAPGDVLLTFTDGVTEAVGGSGEMFGEDRLRSFVKSISGKYAGEITDLVLEEVSSFTRGLPQGDDITVLTLKMKPRTAPHGA